MNGRYTGFILWLLCSALIALGLLLMTNACYFSHYAHEGENEIPASLLDDDDSHDERPYNIAPGSPAYWDSGYPL